MYENNRIINKYNNRYCDIIYVYSNIQEKYK